MPDKVFIDTNILIYSLSADDDRGAKARQTLLSSTEAVVSSQSKGLTHGHGKFCGECGNEMAGQREITS